MNPTFETTQQSFPWPTTPEDIIVNYYGMTVEFAAKHYPTLRDTLAAELERSHD